MLVDGFSPIKEVNHIVEFIRSWFQENGDGCNAVIGISGGKDSSVVAALCVKALGADRVIGVMMPNLTMGSDLDDAIELCSLLGIKHYTVPITTAVSSIHTQIIAAGIVPTNQMAINLPARIRMATLYAVSQSMNGRVANTCNQSEDWIGYSTRYGDSAGDFCPIAHLTVSEVKAIGKALGLPAHLVDKTPSDGLCGQSDEDKIGFTYETLDTYIRTGVCNDAEIKAKIDCMHEKNLFKLRMPDNIAS